MRVLSATWSGHQDKTKIKFSEEFVESDWIVKMDVLGDLIADLSDHYNTLLELDWDARKAYNFKKENQDVGAT
jgi:hypothetical protein